MALGRNIRVSGRYKRDQDYSLLVEVRGQPGQSLLVFPNNRVQAITSQELGELRGEYDPLCDGHALLGNLTVPLDGGHLHFLVLATQCTSVGEKKYCFMAYLRLMEPLAQIIDLEMITCKLRWYRSYFSPV